MFKDRLFTFFILMACVYVITAHVVKREEDSAEKKSMIKKLDELLIGLPLLGGLLGYLLSPILNRVDGLVG
ncbi:hypothetical protein G9C98_008141 [Cotesia typhae]|uniref:Uncharacterized protein n=1 Tax=Cotesia typhae TaxID=2053667 RepID=A0A8J5VAV9_9HYME|nr:hypothetical protein G9C98_008141 [Cotesia typhae]